MCLLWHHLSTVNQKCDTTFFSSSKKPMQVKTFETKSMAVFGHIQQKGENKVQWR